MAWLLGQFEFELRSRGGGGFPIAMVDGPALLHLVGLRTSNLRRRRMKDDWPTLGIGRVALHISRYRANVAQFSIVDDR